MIVLCCTYKMSLIDFTLTLRNYSTVDFSFFLNEGNMVEVLLLVFCGKRERETKKLTCILTLFTN